MSKDNLSSGQSIARPSFEELGICKERYLELRSGCAAGKYSRRTLSKACTGLEFIKPWIILSVTKNKSYDLIEYSEMGRIPIGRSDFYGYRRRFYHNLDCLLKSEQENVPVKERGKG